MDGFRVRSTLLVVDKQLFVLAVWQTGVLEFLPKPNYGGLEFPARIVVPVTTRAGKIHLIWRRQLGFLKNPDLFIKTHGFFCKSPKLAYPIVSLPTILILTGHLALCVAFITQLVVYREVRICRKLQVVRLDVHQLLHSLRRKAVA
jgi:hypothetical protein